MNTTYEVGTLVSVDGPFVTGVSKLGIQCELGVVTKIFIAEDDYLTPLYQVYFIESRTYAVVPDQMLWEVIINFT
jgi:hypothetical protein